MSEAGISRAVGGGRLHHVFRGTYAVGHPAVGERGRLFAAVLACGPGAVVSHRSAAALLGLLDRGPIVIDLIGPGGRGRRIDGIRAHQVRAPRPEELGHVDRIPCTSPSRTMVDLAGVVSDRTLRSCFERSAARGILDLTAIEGAADPCRVGVPTLRLLVDEWRDAATVAATGRLKSPLEAKVLPLLASHGMPPPLPNAPVQLATRRIEVDFLWPEQRLVVEADSREFHATPIAFERDRRRDRDLARAGYTTLRVTRLQVEREAKAVASTIEALLTAGPTCG